MPSSLGGQSGNILSTHHFRIVRYSIEQPRDTVFGLVGIEKRFLYSKKSQLVAYVILNLTFFALLSQSLHVL